MSGTEVEGAAPGSQLTAEEVEDRVMDKIPTLTTEELEEICTLVNIQVDTMRGKKSELRKTLLKVLCGDDTMADILAIHTRLYPDGEEDAVDENNEDEQTNNNDVKIEEEVDQRLNRQETLTSVPNSAENKKTNNTSRREPLPTTNSQRSELIQISRHRLRDLKLPGMIGGEGENAYPSAAWNSRFGKHGTWVTVMRKLLPQLFRRWRIEKCEHCWKWRRRLIWMR